MSGLVVYVMPDAVAYIGKEEKRFLSRWSVLKDVRSANSHAFGGRDLREKYQEFYKRAVDDGDLLEKMEINTSTAVARYQI